MSGLDAMQDMELGAADVSRDPDQVADPRVRSLLDRYIMLSGATVREISPQCWELEVPQVDRKAFKGRRIVRIAFSVDALDLQPEAEMAVIGSAFVGQLIDAIRMRGARLSFGHVAATIPGGSLPPRLETPIVNGRVDGHSSSIARHTVGRLSARVALRAGASLNEYLVDSSWFDLTTGLRLPDAIARYCEPFLTPSNERGASEPDLICLGSRPVDELVERMLADLQLKLAPQIAEQRHAADNTLQLELARIDRYYTGLLQDMGGRGTTIPDAAARRAITAEHARRRADEIRRHEVQAIVHPVQLSEWTVPFQATTWRVVSSGGQAALLSGHRALVGNGEWILGCPSCGAVSSEHFLICKESHVACDRCGAACGVCGEGTCRTHGVSACHIDNRPACAEHARQCASCHQNYCTSHELVCDDGGHPACASCVANCAHCRRPICDVHAVTTVAGAPLGARRLCGECVRYCEGGTSEPVGTDEVVRCASCDRFVCTHHQATCAVDGKIHCSRHLRRTDSSRRLVCAHDQAICSFEPHAIVAADEVWPCASCGKVGCLTHTGVCVQDGQRHCATHLALLVGQPGKLACEIHRFNCHVDGRAYSLAEARECPVCTKRACATHTVRCSSCARSVCVADTIAGRTLCRTCSSLAEIADPSDAVVSAATAIRGERGMPKRWRQARDASHVVIEMEFGWTRRVVFALRHGESQAATVVRHTLLGSTVVRA